MIRLATHRDLTYLSHLQRVYSNQVGYISPRQYEGKIDLGDAWITCENDEPAGMLIAHVHGGNTGLAAARWPDGRAHITQAAIELDLQRDLRGAELVARFAQHAAHRGATFITCSVRDGLPAHAFWQAIGFRPVAVRLGGRGRRRMLVDYAASCDKVSIATRLLTRPPRAPTMDTPSEG